MSTIILKAKSHEEWLKNRANGIGASAVGTIMNCNKYETQYSLWRKLKGLDENPENEAMLMGHLFEDAVAQRYAIATGNQIIKASAAEDVYVCKEKPWMRVSPDRLYVLKGDKKTKKNYRLLECKTAGMNNPIDEDHIPLSYYCQVQYQMHVTGIHKATLAWINLGTRTFGYMDFDYDEDFCTNKMEPRVEKYYRDYIEGDKVPEIKTADDASKCWKRSVEGTKKEATDEEKALVNELAEVKAAIKKFENDDEYKALIDREKQLTDEIKIAMQDNENLVAGETLLVTYKSAKDKVTFDDKAAVEKHPELKELYTSRPGNRSLLIKLKA